MTAIEWIEKAQETIRHAMVSSDYKLNNIQRIEDAMKYLNEAKELLKEKACNLTGHI